MLYQFWNLGNTLQIVFKRLNLHPLFETNMVLQNFKYVVFSGVTLSVILSLILLTRERSIKICENAHNFAHYEGLQISSERLAALQNLPRSIMSFENYENQQVCQETHNIPNIHEEFTIIILTYKRESYLNTLVTSLQGLPLLNKVIIVRNSGQASENSMLLEWKKLGIPIHEVLPTNNSLNNRFIPNKAIETEAILSLDDDVLLTHEDILFGFKVWQNARTRIVGYVGRYHTWDFNEKNWKYRYDIIDSGNYSMALTNAAFFHVSYLQIYTKHMPHIIRHKIDELMNCEDIAINFMVSFLSQCPPLLVDSNIDVLRPEDGLSQANDHYEERDWCLNYFSDLFGYMPLVYNYFKASQVKITSVQNTTTI